MRGLGLVSDGAGGPEPCRQRLRGPPLPRATLAGRAVRALALSSRLEGLTSLKDPLPPPQTFDS